MTMENGRWLLFSGKRRAHFMRRGSSICGKLTEMSNVQALSLTLTPDMMCQKCGDEVQRVVDTRRTQTRRRRAV